MRKSRYITVLLAASSLVACDQSGKPAETVYGDVSACTAEHDAPACKEAYDAARAEHAETAPKFGTTAQCRDAGYDTCQEVEKVGDDGERHGTGMFMPMMMGYMLGRTFGGPSTMAGGAPSSGPGAVGAGGPRPVYADRNGVLYADRGAVVGRTTPGATSIGTIRGGFGNVARGFSGGA